MAYRGRVLRDHEDLSRLPTRAASPVSHLLARTIHSPLSQLVLLV